MRALRLAGALVIVVALAGCSGEDPVMPDVTGQKLDAAQTAIQNAVSMTTSSSTAVASSVSSRRRTGWSASSRLGPVRR